MMRYLITVFIMLAFAGQAQGKDERGLAVTQGGAGKRVALVIGNGNYQHTEILKKLSNPIHDAEDIARALRGFGFEVIEKKDQSQESMRETIAQFSRKIADSDAALFYFAGHGLQVKGQNYLVPIDAKIETEAQAASRSVNVNEILEEMDNAKSKVNIVMLDACRNNTFSGKFRSGAARGLAAPTSQPKGTVIVYATDPGNTADDGDGRNGRFTAGLLSAFKGNDLSLAGVLTRASEEVERGSKQKQTPYVNGPMTLQKSFQFGQGTQVASLVPVPVPAQPAGQGRSKEQIEDDTWKTVEGANTVEAYETYLAGYPNGRYAIQAKVKISTLKKQPVAATKPEPVAVNKPEPATKPAPAATHDQKPAQNTGLANSRYVINGDTVHDKTTNLTWQRCSVGQRWNGAGCVGTVKEFTFDDAQRQAQGEWRVPSKDELATLIDQGRKKIGKSPTIDVVAFPGMDRNKLWYYWSSTPSSASGAWVVCFADGDFYGYGRSVTESVRLVRGGQ